MNGGPVFRGIAAGALLAVAAAWAGMAPAADRGVPFSLDAASFPDSSGGAVTHVYLSVPLTSLRFAAGADGAAFTDLDVAVAIRDRKGHALAEHFWSYRRIPGSLLQQENEGRSLLRRHLFVLPAGESRITARIEAPGGPVLGETTLDHRVPLYADMPLRASDPVFGLCGELVLEAPAANFEGEVLPHPSRLYGDEVPALCVGLFFADTLATAPDSVYWIRYEIRDEAGRGVADSTLTVSRRGSRGEAVLQPSIAGLSMGRYRLQVEARLGALRVRREGSFSVDASRIASPRDADQLRTVLGYVATNDELILIDDAPDDSLEAIWTRFWARRDPDPDTALNEALVEFMRRVEHATRNFGVLEPGWRSDMGRIYIRYGPPDQADRAVQERGYPTEVWTYYGRNATFVFQDQDGFGRYRLVGTRRN